MVKKDDHITEIIAVDEKGKIEDKVKYFSAFEEEGKIIVDENTKEELNKQLLKKMKRLTIWGVGELANKKLKPGQEVLVNPQSLAQAQMVPFEEPVKEGKEGETEEVVRALIQDFDIIHIWN